jgi:hypothetical protein
MMPITEGTAPRSTRGWLWCAVIFGIVAAVQLWLVGIAGTDIPYQDQWDAEGVTLYPQYRDGTLTARDVFRPHNEHRIVVTKLLDLGLFVLNGQWDPLVQLVLGALLKGAVAAALFGGLTKRQKSWTARPLAAGFVLISTLPHLGWHNALWGFQSQVYFAVLFSAWALRLFIAVPFTPARQAGAFTCAVAAQLAMSAGVFVPVAVVALAAIRALQNRTWRGGDTRRVAWATILLVIAVLLRGNVPAHAGLHARSVANGIDVFALILAWPLDSQPWAALALNAPLLLLVVSRARSRPPRGLGKASTHGGEKSGSSIATSGQDEPRDDNKEGENFAMLLALWSIAGAAAVAWFRGGGGEFSFGVPSRYIDFFVLFPIANAWCLFIQLREVSATRRKLANVCGVAWLVLLSAGWLGLSAEVVRGLIFPRIRDRDAPVRLAVAFQQSGNPNIFAGQPRLLVPHPNLEIVQRVLLDPRMQGVLPPSLQPDRPMGPLSRFVRWLLRRDPSD